MSLRKSQAKRGFVPLIINRKNKKKRCLKTPVFQRKLEEKISMLNTRWTLQILTIKSPGCLFHVIYKLCNFEISKTKPGSALSPLYNCHYLICTLFCVVYASMKLNIITWWNLNKGLNWKHISKPNSLIWFTRSWPLSCQLLCSLYFSVIKPKIYSDDFAAETSWYVLPL